MKSLRFIAFWIVTLMPAMTPLSNAQERTAILPENTAWSYVFTPPTVKNWTMQYPLPKGGYNVGEMHTNKNWPKNKPNVWMTAKVTLPADYKPGNLFLQYRHDDDVAIFINGKLVYQAMGHCAIDGKVRTRTKLIPNGLKPGDNFVAVFCKDRGETAYVYVTLWTDGNPPLNIESVLPPDGKWSYTFDDPGQRWTTQFPLPKSKLAVGPITTTLLWPSKHRNVWMTQVVTLPANYTPEEVIVQCINDDRAWIYVNGEELSLPKFDGHWKQARHVKNLLRPGKNIIAVRCENKRGAGYVSVDIFTRKYTDDEKKNPLEYLQREPPPAEESPVAAEENLTEAEVKIKRAMDCFRIGQDTLAVAELKRIAEGDEKDIQANCILGMHALTKRNAAKDGLAYFKKCVNLDKKNPAILNNYAVAAMENKRYVLALQVWEYLAKIDATLPALGQNVGCMMDLMNRKRIVLKEEEQLRLVALYIAACSDQNRDRDANTGFLLMPIPGSVGDRPDCESAFTYEFKRGRETVTTQPYEVRRTHYGK